MALVTVAGWGVVRGTISLPRIGAWHADLDLDTAAEVSGQVTIDVAGALALVGTITAGGTVRGVARVRIVAGADGLRLATKPQHFVRPPFRTVLEHLARNAGETLSTTASAAVLGRQLNAWTALGLATGEQIAALVERAAPAGTAWRMLADGSLWVGPETWPASTVQGVRELGRHARERRLELGMDAPLLQPGTMLGEDRIDYVEHVLDEGRVRASAWVIP